MNTQSSENLNRHPEERTDFHSTWRLQLAREVAAAYAENPKVVTVFAHGSAARYRADRFSDVELAILWSEAPSDAERQDAINRAGGTVCKFSSYEPALQAWTEEYSVAEVKIDTGHWIRPTLETILGDVLERYDTTFAKQTTLSIIQHAFGLYGNAQLAAYQAQIALYPAELASAMILKHLSFAPFGSREMLAARNEIPLLYENHCRSLRQILGVLLGLNHIYYPGFKWTRQLIAEMAITPPDLFARFERVLQSDALSGTRELRQLIEEVFDLVEAHVPAIDVASYRVRFREPYPSWNGMSARS